MKPWEIKSSGKKPTDAFLIPLWAEFRPKDFYFATSHDEESTVVYIVPADYYEKFGCMYDDSIPIVQHLPNYLEEIFECVYEAPREMNLDFIHADMLRRGFSHNYFFQQFIDRNKDRTLSF